MRAALGEEEEEEVADAAVGVDAAVVVAARRRAARGVVPGRVIVGRGAVLEWVVHVTQRVTRRPRRVDVGPDRPGRRRGGVAVATPEGGRAPEDVGVGLVQGARVVLVDEIRRPRADGVRQLVRSDVDPGREVREGAAIAVAKGHLVVGGVEPGRVVLRAARPRGELAMDRGRDRCTGAVVGVPVEPCLVVVVRHPGAVVGARHGRIGRSAALGDDERTRELAPGPDARLVEVVDLSALRRVHACEGADERPGRRIDVDVLEDELTVRDPHRPDGHGENGDSREPPDDRLEDVDDLDVCASGRLDPVDSGSGRLRRRQRGKGREIEARHEPAVDAEEPVSVDVDDQLPTEHGDSPVGLRHPQV